MRLRQKKIHVLGVRLAVLLLLFGIEAYGQTWTAVGEGVDGGVTLTSVNTLQIYNNELYAGGDFYSAGTTEANFIAKWDGSQWASVGIGVYGVAYRGVLALAEFNGELYAGGDFSRAGDAIVSYVAKWNGQSWSSVGSGMNGSVVALAVYKNELFAGSDVAMAGGTGPKYIARWDGTAWKSAGEGINNSVLCLQVYDDELYVGGGGNFTLAGGVTSGGIAKWDGTRWSPVGIAGKKPQPTQVRALAAYKNELYAAGVFTNEQGQEIHGVAKWDGSQWTLLGSGFNGSVFCLTAFNGQLYAGGGRYDSAAGKFAVGFVAHWNDTTWALIGSDMNGAVSSLAVNNNQLYAGGGFTIAGGVQVNGIARLSLSVDVKDNPNNLPSEYDLLQNYPNPFNAATTIEFHLPHPSQVTLEVFNLLGERAATLLDQKKFMAGAHKINWQAEGLTSGVYFYHLRVNGSFEKTRKLILLK